MSIAESEHSAVHTTAGNASEYGNGAPGNDIVRSTGDKTDIVSQVSVIIAC